ncbi:magnesium-dependent phosphatase 1 [Blastocystis sp. subtype 4]|uniref:magnesium-dependent phosphatase 1 n=1 Tax=Blastocystis sp. subtype 4 TaxID=944170 RepID=UPI0007114073|nr:magnesium-dependent phosphatase 1 [Blastocystis sp. subtype 4]KNB44639.1 magnesium-dependent phosphatase 1 [Blastocystis sp. subtype 4]|eukprot:XP_014528077.1 magnesium-dependent phosphatase 1 [Blastocystis sp. subtype 4]
MNQLSPLARTYKEAFDGRMIVFDMDGTLWWFWMDTHITPPVKRHGMGFKDRDGNVFDFFPDVREILLALHEAGIPIALASSTWAPSLGQKIIDLIKVDEHRTLGDIVSYRELITCRKFTHFENIKNESCYSYEQMIFIDDEKHNLDDIETIGVMCFYEPQGISKKVFEKIVKRVMKEC